MIKNGDKIMALKSSYGIREGGIYEVIVHEGGSCFLDDNGMPKMIYPYWINYIEILDESIQEEMNATHKVVFQDEGVERFSLDYYSYGVIGNELVVIKKGE